MTSAFSGAAAIAGIDATEFSKESGRSELQLSAEATLGALDFAGGTAIHINAGISSLVIVAMIGKRKGYPNEPMPPHNLPFTLIGTGILWFGWFVFNAGSAGAANAQAAQALVNTSLAAEAARPPPRNERRLRATIASTCARHDISS